MRGILRGRGMTIGSESCSPRMPIYWKLHYGEGRVTPSLLSNGIRSAEFDVATSQDKCVGDETGR